MRAGLAAGLVPGGDLLALLAAVGLVRFPDLLTRMHSAAKAATLGVILLMNSVTFPPGTVALEVEEGCLHVHALHLGDPEDLIAGVQRLEEHIIAAFGTPEERTGGG